MKNINAVSHDGNLIQFYILYLEVFDQNRSSKIWKTHREIQFVKLLFRPLVVRQLESQRELLPALYQVYLTLQYIKPGSSEPEKLAIF